MSRFLLVPLAVVLLAGCAGSTAKPAPAPRANPEVRWTFKTTGPIWGSAAVKSGVLYVGSNDKSVYALDANSGSQKWAFTTQGDIRTRPAFSGKNVIFSSDDGSLYAVDAASGAQVWKTDIHNTHQRLALNDPHANFDFDFMTSSPIVSGNKVFVGSADGNVYGLDAATGSVSWTFKTSDRIRATPAVDKGVVFIGSWDGYLYALKADDGSLVWKYLAGVDGNPRYLTLPIQSTATISNNKVYCASRKAATFAVNATTGEKLWEAGNGTGNWLESSPVVANGNVYIGSSAASNLNEYSDTGVPQGPYSLGGPAAWSTPYVDKGTVYIGSEGYLAGQKGGLWAVNSDPNGGLTDSRWFFEVDNSVEPAGYNGVNSQPLLIGRVLYFGGLDGVVYALNV